MSKSAFARAGAGIEAIEIREVAPGTPQAGEVLVRLKAATLNYRDLLLATRDAPGQTKAPMYVPLSCGAGEVVAVGAGVTRLKAGDRVSPTYFQDVGIDAAYSDYKMGGTVDGAARQHGVFAERSLVLIPDELSDLEAATLPCAGLTAWSSVMGDRPIRSGEWVAVQGTGGVSIAALQWAKAAGGKVVVTSSSDAKLARARALGADVTVNYRTTPDWTAAARAAIGGGVDIVVDLVGQSQLEAIGGLLNEGGTIAGVGLLAGQRSAAQATRHRFLPIGVGSRRQHEAMLAFAVTHRIRPVVDMVYDLDHLPDALRHQQSSDFFGKIGIDLA